MAEITPQPPVLQCHVMAGPAHTESGGAPAFHEIVWHVQINEHCTATEAMALARQVNPVGGMTPVPPKGAHLDIQSALGNIIDENAYALDFSCVQVSQSQSIFQVGVTYRPPRVGEDEVPEKLLAYPYDPVARGAEVWLDFQDTNSPANEGYLQTWSGTQWDEATEKTSLSMTNKERMEGAFFIPGFLTIVIAEYHSPYANEAQAINADFEGTCNELPLEIVGLEGPGGARLTVEKHGMRFLRAEQSRQFNRGWGTWTVQTRWLLDPKNFHVVEFPNQGSYTLTDDGKIKTTETVQGQQVPPPYQLDKDGKFLPDVATLDPFDLKRRYRILEEENYIAKIPYFVTPSGP